MTDSLTGVWDGTFVQHGGVATFLATLIESGGAVGGNATEPCTVPDCPLSTHNASIAGHRSGSAVSFVKRYERSGYGDDTVFYEGSLNAEATENRWALEIARHSAVLGKISDGPLNQACTIDHNRRTDRGGGALMRFEILPGLPPYGPRAISFTRNGACEHREGLVVRFYPDASEPWTGNFLGSETDCSTVLHHPNEAYVIVVAQGEACIVDPERRAVIDRIAGFIDQVFSVPSLGSVVFQRATDFIAIKADSSGWYSPRISWDGFRNIEVHETELRGEAYTPGGDVWVPFKLDLLTGHCTDGIYQKEMSSVVISGA